MAQFISWNDLYTLAGVLVMVVGAVWHINNTVNEMRRESSESDALLRKELADYKIEVANRYVTSDAIRQWKDELTQAINRLGDRLDRLVEKAG